MGLWEDLIGVGVGVSGGGGAYEMYKKMKNPPVPLLQYRGELVEGLSEIDKGLSRIEHLSEFTEHYDKIKKARESLGKVKVGLTMPSNIMTNLEEIRDLKNAISDISRIDAKADPVGAAKAYGAAMQSFGRLAQNLPPPASSVGELLEELGSWFHTVVQNIVPHTRPAYQKYGKEINNFLK